MKNTIYLLEGTYRNKTVENQTFQVVKGYQSHPHKEGGFITVKIDDLEKFPGATKKQIRNFKKQLEINKGNDEVG